MSKCTFLKLRQRVELNTKGSRQKTNFQNNVWFSRNSISKIALYVNSFWPVRTRDLRLVGGGGGGDNGCSPDAHGCQIIHHGYSLLLSQAFFRMFEEHLVLAEVWASDVLNIAPVFQMVFQCQWKPLNCYRHRCVTRNLISNLACGMSLVGGSRDHPPSKETKNMKHKHFDFWFFLRVFLLVCGVL